MIMMMVMMMVTGGQVILFFFKKDSHYELIMIRVFSLSAKEKYKVNAQKGKLVFVSIETL